MSGLYLIAFASQSSDYRKESEYWTKYHSK